MLPKSATSFFITLIPKVDFPLELIDIRPKSLFGSFYKLVSKVLANRLIEVMNSLAWKSTFIKGIQLVYSAVTFNGMVFFTRLFKRERLVFKVDFLKLYDNVS